jgi:hypothetical protein
MKKIVSTLDKIAEAVFVSKDLITAQNIAITHLNESKIKESDKNKMIQEITNITSLQKLQYYCANALLKYEGLGVGNKLTFSPVEEPNKES